MKPFERVPSIRARRWFAMSLMLTLLASIFGCGVAPVTKSDEPSASSYAIQLTASSFAGLPKCKAALAGTTAFVESPASLWSCIADVWLPIPCTKLQAGAVAYSSDSKLLLACVAGSWTRVTVEPGAKGDPGPAGADGAGALVNAVPEPVGSHCAAGGLRLDFGIDTNKNQLLEASEVRTSTYVCNGVPAAGQSGAGGSATGGESGVAGSSAGSNQSGGSPASGGSAGTSGGPPQPLSITPRSASIQLGETLTFTVLVDEPVSVDTVVALSVSPSAAGVLSASVTIPAGATSATFSFLSTQQGTVAIIATLLGSSATATITVADPHPHPVINEVDYDQVGADTREFVEIYNPSKDAIDLTNRALIFVNGNDSAVYLRIDLFGTLPAGGYLVVGSNSVAVPAGAIVIRFPVQTDAIQNGSPDGVALIDVSNGTVVDALSYEGRIDLVRLGSPFPATTSLVEGTPLPLGVADSNTVDGSMARTPNGVDSNDASIDWRFVGTPTPGAPNVMF